MSAAYDLGARQRDFQVDAQDRSALRRVGAELNTVLRNAIDTAIRGLGPSASGLSSSLCTHWDQLLKGEGAEVMVRSADALADGFASRGLGIGALLQTYPAVINALSAALLAKAIPSSLFAKGDASVCGTLEALTRVAFLDADLAVARLEARLDTRRQSEFKALADSFEADVSRIVSTLAGSATDLESSARAMAATADRASECSASVAAAAEQATANVSVVATSAEEMGKSVAEIAEQVSHSAKIAGEAVTQAHTTGETIESLARAADKIGEVISLISDIASQTNLLALNATIESARAGEAGRGFAVVAAEVKTLANQTAKATGDISTQIQEIQNVTRASVQAIAHIRKTIDDMNATSLAINAAVEEQSAATREIARNTHEAADGTQDVARNIVEVQAAAEQTGAATFSMVDAASQVGEHSRALQGVVSRFLEKARAA